MEVLELAKEYCGDVNRSAFKNLEAIDEFLCEIPDTRSRPELFM